MRTEIASELKSLRLYCMASAWADLLGQGETAALQSARWLLEHLLQAEGVDRAMRSVSYQDERVCKILCKRLINSRRKPAYP